MIPDVGPLGKFQHNIEISIKTVFLDYPFLVTMAFSESQIFYISSFVALFEILWKVTIKTNLSLVRLFETLAATCTAAIVKMHTQHFHPSFRCLKSTIKTLEPGKNTLKVNNKDNRTPFDNVVLVFLFLSFNFKNVSYLVLMFLLLTLNM